MECISWDKLSINGNLWIFLLFFAVILIWNRYPKSGCSTDSLVCESEGIKRLFFLALRIIGIGLLIYLAAIFKGSADGKEVWMRTQWWGIIGLIGWAYFTSATAYLFFRKQIAAMMGLVGLLTLLYIGDKIGAINFLGILKEYVWFGGQIGGHSSITVAGVIVSMLFMEYSPAENPSKKILWIIIFGIGLFVAGFLLYPLYGINKNTATPTWCLYCSGICCLIYAFLYWLMDLKNVMRWANFLKPAGANPLLAYILPDIFYAVLALIGITFLDKHLNEGIVGILRSAVFSVFMLYLTRILARLKITLRL